MIKSLRYISISHKTATVIQRSRFHISDEEMMGFADLVRSTFQDISGLFILATCNRTEFYFESVDTTSNTFCDFLLDLKSSGKKKSDKGFFKLRDDTKNSVEHLLEVSAGLDSSVIGDAEIIHQIKKAQQFSVANNMQGSLLERALQAVFKSHKRITNETHFRDGTTSLAYKALKIIKNLDESTLQKNKSILFVGAGDIVKQLFKYNARFNFNNIYISNRTRENAVQLANEYQCKIYEWDKVLANDFQQFDVIISAVSNCKNLIKILPSDKSKVLLIDLSIEGCIDRELAQKKHIVFYDLDTISEDLKGARKKRFAAIDEVKKIIVQELSFYNDWIMEAPLRELLLKLKININRKVRNELEINDEQKIKAVTNQVMRKIVHRHQTILKPTSKINEIIFEQAKIYDDTHS